MIIRNSARCRGCGDEIESRHRHDFVSCTCGAIFVDGGKDYLRAGDLHPEKPFFESTSIVEPDPSEDINSGLHSTYQLGTEGNPP